MSIHWLDSIISSRMIGTVIKEAAADLSSSSVTDVGDGMIADEGKQYDLPVDRLRHGARRPNP
jgi:hypothetical protein